MTLEPTKHGFRIVGHKGTILGYIECVAGSDWGHIREWAAIRVVGVDGEVVMELRPRLFKVTKKVERDRK